MKQLSDQVREVKQLGETIDELTDQLAELTDSTLAQSLAKSLAVMKDNFTAAAAAVESRLVPALAAAQARLQVITDPQRLALMGRHAAQLAADLTAIRNAHTRFTSQPALAALPQPPGKAPASLLNSLFGGGAAGGRGGGLAAIAGIFGGGGGGGIPGLNMAVGVIGMLGPKGMIAAAALSVVAVALGKLKDAVLGAVRAFLEVPDKIKPFVEAFSPATARLFDFSVRDLLASIGRFLEPLLEGFRQFNEAINAAFTAVGNELRPAFADFGRAVAIIGQAVGELLVAAMRNLAPYLQVVARFATDMAAVLAPLGQEIGKLLGLILPQLAEVLKNVIYPNLLLFAKVLVPLITLSLRISEALRTVLPIFWLLEGLSEVAQALNEFLTTVVRLDDLLKDFSDSIALLGEVLVTMARHLREGPRGWLALTDFGRIVREARDSLQQARNQLGGQTRAAGSASYLGVEEVARRAQVAALGTSSLPQQQLEEARGQTAILSRIAGAVDGLRAAVAMVRNSVTQLPAEILRGLGNLSFRPFG